MHGAIPVHGQYVTHKGKKHQLYHHHEKGHGIIDSVGNWISKAYTAAKNVHSHLKEKRYAHKALSNPLINAGLSYVPHVKAVVQHVADAGYG